MAEEMLLTDALEIKDDLVSDIHRLRKQAYGEVLAILEDRHKELT
jgi:hypothetical protein